MLKLTYKSELLVNKKIFKIILDFLFGLFY